MKVREVMKKKVITISAKATYEDAAKVLHQANISGAPVVDDEGAIIGVVSEKDLFKVLYPYYSSFYEHPESYVDFEEREKKVGEIKNNPITRFMSKTVVTTEPDVPIMKVGALMIAKGIHRLPVVEAGKLVGIVSREEIFQQILKKQLGL